MPGPTQTGAAPVARLPRAFGHLRVASESGLRTALADFRPDVVLSDFRMPGFSGQQALEMVMTLAPAVPFLFVSGTIGEELAIDSPAEGAVDYVLKDNLRRLPNAIERTQDIAPRGTNAEADRAGLARRRSAFAPLSKAAAAGSGNATRIPASLIPTARCKAFLAAARELSTMSGKDLLLAEDRGEVVEKLKLLAAAGQGWQGWHMRWQHRDGSVHVSTHRVSALRQARQDHRLPWIARDITERLNREAQIRHLARIHSGTRGARQCHPACGITQPVVAADLRSRRRQGWLHLRLHQ
ncbi:MAG: response regulator [Xanthomonadales bacterium]|nr:response regulator [Xanthomonadales bacterium]